MRLEALSSAKGSSSLPRRSEQKFSGTISRITMSFPGARETSFLLQIIHLPSSDGGSEDSDDLGNETEADISLLADYHFMRTQSGRPNGPTIRAPLIYEGPGLVSLLLQSLLTPGPNLSLEAITAAIKDRLNNDGFVNLENFTEADVEEALGRLVAPVCYRLVASTTIGNNKERLRTVDERSMLNRRIFCYIDGGCIFVARLSEDGQSWLIEKNLSPQSLLGGEQLAVISVERDSEQATVFFADHILRCQKALLEELNRPPSSASSFSK